MQSRKVQNICLFGVVNVKKHFNCKYAFSVEVGMAPTHVLQICIQCKLYQIMNQKQQNFDHGQENVGKYSLYMRIKLKDSVQHIFVQSPKPLTVSIWVTCSNVRLKLGGPSLTTWTKFYATLTTYPLEWTIYILPTLCSCNKPWPFC